jgi:glutamate racemase
VRKLNPDVQVTEVAAPLLAPIVEEAWEETDIARMAVRRYMEAFSGIDTLVLGCTHYPLLEQAFREVVSSDVTVLNPAPCVAERFADWRSRHPGFALSGHGRLRTLSTGDSGRFAAFGARFLGETLPQVEHVAREHGRLSIRPEAPGSEEPVEPVGQVVRSRSVRF